MIEDWVSHDEIKRMFWHDGGDALFHCAKTADDFPKSRHPAASAATWNLANANKIAGRLGNNMAYQVSVHGRYFSAKSIKNYIDNGDTRQNHKEPKT